MSNELMNPMVGEIKNILETVRSRVSKIVNDELIIS